MIEWLYPSLFLFVFGAILGSFANVLIYRMPRKLSILRPASNCPFCKHPVRFYHNIPILSFLFLRGRCAYCGKEISSRYFWVELIMALAFGGAFLLFGFSWEMLRWCLLWFVGLTIFFIDIDFQIIPNQLSLGLLVISFVIAIFDRTFSIMPSLMGMIIGGGSLFLVAYLYQKFTGMEGLGGGDIKLMAALGALFGWKNALLTIFFSSIFGLLYVIIARKSARQAIPFGPFIFLAAVVMFLFGKNLADWYLNLIIPR